MFAFIAAIVLITIIVVVIATGLDNGPHGFS